MYQVAINRRSTYPFSDEMEARDFAVCWRAVLKDERGAVLNDYTNLPEFEEVRVCPHCGALTRESYKLEMTLCSDGCGCLEGYRNVYKFQCPICNELRDEPKCACITEAKLV